MLKLPLASGPRRDVVQLPGGLGELKGDFEVLLLMRLRVAETPLDQGTIKWVRETSTVSSGCSV